MIGVTNAIEVLSPIGANDGMVGKVWGKNNRLRFSDATEFFRDACGPSILGSLASEFTTVELDLHEEWLSFFALTPMDWIVRRLGIPFKVVVCFGDGDFGIFGNLCLCFQEGFPGQVIDVVPSIFEEFADEGSIFGEGNAMAWYA